MIFSFKKFSSIDNLINQIKSECYGIKRKDMPQIAGEHYEDFRQWLATNKITCFEIDALPSQYKATQCEFDKTKIINLSKAKSNSSPPILVTSDHYILDGHHRWIAAWLDSNRLFKALQLPTDIKTSLQYIHDYDNIEYKKMKENKSI